MDDGETVIEVPVPTKVPPHDPEYQYQLVPELSDPNTIPIVIEDPAQIVGGPFTASTGSVEAVQGGMSELTGTAPVESCKPLDENAE